MEFSPLTGAGALVSVIGCSGSEGRGWQYREPHSGGQIACPRRTSAIRIPMLASPLRRDREDRCDAGAAPATVSGEIAAEATEPAKAWEGAAIDEPEPGDLLVVRTTTILGGRRGRCWDHRRTIRHRRCRT